MLKQLKRLLVIAAGALFIIVGFFGLALPFLQGVIFLVVGTVLLSLVSSQIRAWMDIRTRPHPRLHRFFESVQKWVTRFIGSTD